jgi:hypothetical protein
MTQKFCKDCTHFSPHVRYNDKHSDVNVCGYPAFQRRSVDYLVTGLMLSPSTLAMRSTVSACGYQGHFYDPEIL